jgi:hypothetical protein
MATGRNTQITRQIGEHLVVAKLGRLGYIATPFAGNVPNFDVLIADNNGNSIPIQVKAINGPAWQFDIGDFLIVEMEGDNQIVKGKRKLVNPKLICVFVLLSPDENDKYFIMKLSDLQEYFSKTYKSRHRPKNPTSMHCAIWPKDIQKHKDNWGLIKESLGNKST